MSSNRQSRFEECDPRFLDIRPHGNERERSSGDNDWFFFLLRLMVSLYVGWMTAEMLWGN
jgi:hypothetical protein